VLGIADVSFVPGRETLAIVDGTLSGDPPGMVMGPGEATGERRNAPKLGPNEIGIDNFQFEPPSLSVRAGTAVTWVNGDDVPHLIASADGHFQSSKVLDTGGRFTVTFAKPGTYSYFCSLHPKMQGKVVVAGD
jgi:Icc protein